MLLRDLPQNPFSTVSVRSGLLTMSAARPLFHRKRKSIHDLAMSHSCQKRTHALQQTETLFDHLVGKRQKIVRDFDAKRLRGLKIDHKLKLGYLCDRQVGWLLTL